MPTFDVNYLAVLVAAVTNMILGFLWYGPLFGKMWLKAIGKTQEEISGSNTANILSGLLAIVGAFALALVLAQVSDLTVGSGIVWGVVVAIGFIATTTVINGLYEDRPSTVTWLYVIYQLVAYSAGGAIIAAFG